MTAVQWLLYQIEHNQDWYSYLGKIDIKKEALEMERRIIADAHTTGMFLPCADGFEYYKENFDIDKKNRP
jgi:hypothetical protein